MKKQYKQWNPKINPPRPRLSNLEGSTANDIVSAAMAISNDEWVRKLRRRDAREEAEHKAAISGVSLAKMPWDDGGENETT